MDHVTAVGWQYCPLEPDVEWIHNSSDASSFVTLGDLKQVRRQSAFNFPFQAWDRNYYFSDAYFPALLTLLTVVELVYGGMENKIHGGK